MKRFPITSVISVFALWLTLATMSWGMAPNSAPVPELSAIEQFVAAHPAVIVWIWGSVISLLAALVGLIIWAGRRGLDSLDRTNTEFRTDLKQFMVTHSADIRQIYASMASQAATMDARWEKLFSELQLQGRTLSVLQGEHNIISKHHASLAMMRRGDIEPNREPDGNGGD